MKTIYHASLSILLVSILSCNNAKKENTSDNPSSIQKLINPADDLLGFYSTKKDKIKEIDFKLVKESGRYILYNYNKNKSSWVLYTEMTPISGEDTRAFVGFSIFKNLLNDTGLYSDKTGGMGFFKIKQGAEVRTTWASGKSASEYLLISSNGSAKNAFKVTQ
ncbi:hypothetical protein [Chryseobacterium sp. MEBOG07]|uniref:hypothetical protein n=1 Tax=Chryseobacterium sp. MEBOG07 TaxID=2879939 RepID=UPI001F1A8B76|nr:hypothetical protein [Chryseobacterium sp. MEBOG07]UKB79555.1 hypothetical protein LF886_00680 [Chryseobacterium sp. MEBOG07]